MVQHFALFFTQPPPVGYGAAIYHQAASADWLLLGYLTADKPSAIYKLSEPTSVPTRLGIDIEPVSTFTLPPPALPSTNSTNQAVTRVLESLYNFIMSFTSDPTNPAQSIPVRLFNDWYLSMSKRYS